MSTSDCLTAEPTNFSKQNTLNRTIRFDSMRWFKWTKQFSEQSDSQGMNDLSNEKYRMKNRQPSIELNDSGIKPVRRSFYFISINVFNLNVRCLAQMMQLNVNQSIDNSVGLIGIFSFWNDKNRRNASFHWKYNAFHFAPLLLLFISVTKQICWNDTDDARTTKRGN